MVANGDCKLACAVKFMTLVATWRSNNIFFITFDVKKTLLFYDITRKYRLFIHCWIRLDLLITEQFNLLKSDKN
jgi:hypothetical protein